MIEKIIFAAGGTGGHIYPALAVADELKKMNKGTKIKFIGAKSRIEEKIIPQNGYELETLELKGFRREMSPDNLKNLVRLIRSLRKSKNILKDFKPEVIFATGGFVSWPVARAARSLRIPVVVLEGNYYPGLAVRLLSGIAERVIVNFSETSRYLKRKDNVVVIGYPFRSNFKCLDRKMALEYFGLNQDKKTLLVMGGSQGARSINSAILNHCENLLKFGIQIIWQTGESDYENISSAIRNDSVRILKYIDEISYAYSAADVLLCRAGISTLTEAAFFGLPMILVPYPYSSDNHQMKNAESLVNKKAAEIIPDSEINNLLFTKVTELINNEQLLHILRKNVKCFADEKSAFKIAHLLNEIAGRKN